MPTKKLQSKMIKNDKSDSNTLAIGCVTLIIILAVALEIVISFLSGLFD
jgi:hypothetical protein